MSELLAEKNPEGLTENQQRLADGIFKIQGIIFGEFTLNSGVISPYYCDLKYLIEFPELKKLAVEEYHQLLTSLKFDLIAPVPDGTTAISSSVADSLGVGSIVPRIKEKIHGAKSPIIGLPKDYENKNIALIDDVITKGNSAIRVIKLLNANKVSVSYLAVLVEREEGGVQKIEKETGVKVLSTFRISQLMDYGYRTGKIDRQNYQRFKNYLAGQRAT